MWLKTATDGFDLGQFWQSGPFRRIVPQAHS
jgi:hypothetical protein